MREYINEYSTDLNKTEPGKRILARFAEKNVTGLPRQQFFQFTGAKAPSEETCLAKAFCST